MEPDNATVVVNAADAYIANVQQSAGDAASRLLTSCRKGKLVSVVVTTRSNQPVSEMITRIL